ncbi:hypothetical protein GCM10009532_13600 [Microbacterium aurantiacum]
MTRQVESKAPANRSVTATVSMYSAQTATVTQIATCPQMSLAVEGRAWTAGNGGRGRSVPH